MVFDCGFQETELALDGVLLTLVEVEVVPVSSSDPVQLGGWGEVVVVGGCSEDDLSLTDARPELTSRSRSLSRDECENGLVKFKG